MVLIIMLVSPLSGDYDFGVYTHIFEAEESMGNDLEIPSSSGLPDSNLNSGLPGIYYTV